MKSDIHSQYRTVCFEDASTGDRWLCGSASTTTATVEVDGVIYPHVRSELSNMSHPFYTGKMKIVDTAGRVDRFNRRYGARKAH